LVAGTRCYVIDSKHTADIFWPCFKGNPQRTGNTADIPTSSPDGRHGEPRPTALWLSPAFPNPSASMTTLSFGLPEPDHVLLRVHATDGRLVSTLMDGPLGAGFHTLVWDGRDSHGALCASGIYVCSLASGNGGVARKVVRIR